MNLTPEAIKEFQKLFEEEFEISLSEDETIKEAEDLLQLMALAKGQRDVF